MILNRRTLLAAAPGLAIWPAVADEGPPALATYERETGGRIGVYAENLATGAQDRLARRRALRHVQHLQGLAAASGARPASTAARNSWTRMIPYSAADIIDDW